MPASEPPSFPAFFLMVNPTVKVIGGGLAGSEAAWQLARRGYAVDLCEMRPKKRTEAHSSGHLSELVCSNSFRALSLSAPAGLLKEEMRRLGSLTIRVAEAHRVPAGGALAVDRDGFARGLTRVILDQPCIKIRNEEVTEIPSGLSIVATGPLTSEELSRNLQSLLGASHLYFYDAISPIVTAESVDQGVAFRASRYGRGEGDYLNLPLGREDYHRFIDALLAAEKVPLKSFERFLVFEGCMPIEEMAARGRETLAFGPMRPVGLADPRTGRRPYAVLQLRQENREATLYNLVGCQTKMIYPEQKRVFSLIPGLEKGEFVRYGSLHRNTFMDSPRHLLPTLQWRGRSDLLFAGQITGVEGYIESAACGLLAGINAARILRGLEPLVLPPTTALGALLCYITDPERKEFQPMNANFGLLPPLPSPVKGKAKRLLLAERGLRDLDAWLEEVGEASPSSLSLEA